MLVAECKAHSRRHLVIGYEPYFIYEVTNEGKRHAILKPNAAPERVGEARVFGNFDWRACLDAALHGRAAIARYADDARRGPHAPRRERDTGREAAAADRDDDSGDARKRFHDLDPDGTLTRHHHLIVERVHQDQPFFGGAGV